MVTKIHKILPILIMAVVYFLLLPFVHAVSTIDLTMAPRFTVVAVSLSLLAVLLLFTSTQESWLTIRMKGLHWWVLAYTAWTIIGAFYAHSFSEGLFDASKVVLLACSYFLLGVLLPRKGAIDVLIKTALWSPFCFLLFEWLRVEQVFQQLSHPVPLMEVFNNHLINIALGSKNLYSINLLLTLPFSMYGLFMYRGWWRWVSLVGGMLTLAMILILQTISVWLGLGVAVMGGLLLLLWQLQHLQLSLAFLAWPGKVRGVLLAGCLLVGLVAAWWYTGSHNYRQLKHKVWTLVHFDPTEELDTHQVYVLSNSVYDRVLLYRNTVKMIGDNPVFGVGTGSWKFEFPRYGVGGRDYLNSGAQQFVRPHNDWLWVASEGGLIGLLLYAGLFVVALRRLVRQFREALDAKGQAVVLLVWMGLLALAGVSFLSFPKERIFPLLMFSVYLALAEVGAGQPSQPTVKDRRWFGGIVVGVLPVCAFLVYVGWMRLDGEQHARKMILQKTRGDWEAVASEALAAGNPFYVYDNAGIPLHWYKGLAWYELGFPEKACRDFAAAYAQHPYQVYVLTNHAACLERQHQQQDAIRVYREALAITPRFAEALKNLTALYYNSGQVDSAYYTFRMYPFLYRKDFKVYMLPILKSKLERLEGQYPALRGMVVPDDRLLEWERLAQREGKAFEEVVVEGMGSVGL